MRWILLSPFSTWEKQLSRECWGIYLKPHCLLVVILSWCSDFKCFHSTLMPRLSAIFCRKPLLAQYPICFPLVVCAFVFHAENSPHTQTCICQRLLSLDSAPSWEQTPCLVYCGISGVECALPGSMFTGVHAVFIRALANVGQEPYLQFGLPTMVAYVSLRKFDFLWTRSN